MQAKVQALQSANQEDKEGYTQALKDKFDLQRKIMNCLFNILDSIRYDIDGIKSLIAQGNDVQNLKSNPELQDMIIKYMYKLKEQKEAEDLERDIFALKIKRKMFDEILMIVFLNY